MTWELVYTVPYSQTLRPLLIERVFSKSILVVEAQSRDAKPNWYKAGLLYPFVNIADVGRVKSFGQPINLDKQLVKFDWLGNIEFQLEFYAYSWIPNISLNFWESDDMPSYSTAPTSYGITYNASSNTVAVDSTKSVNLSPAITGKTGSVITNNSKLARLFVSINVPASLTVYDKILAYQESYETPYNWTGDVFGIWDKPDPTGNARVRDFS